MGFQFHVIDRVPFFKKLGLLLNRTAGELDRSLPKRAVSPLKCTDFEWFPSTALPEVSIFTHRTYPTAIRMVQQMTKPGLVYHL